MIIGFLLNIFFNIIYYFLSLLPTGGLSSNVATAFNYIFGVLHSFDFIIPTGTVVSILTILVTFHGAILLFNMLNWTLGKIRGSN